MSVEGYSHRPAAPLAMAAPQGGDDRSPAPLVVERLWAEVRDTRVLYYSALSEDEPRLLAQLVGRLQLLHWARVVLGESVERSGPRRTASPARRSALLYLGTGGGVLVLRYRQQRWYPLHCGLAGQAITALAVLPNHPEIIFAASGDTIYHSTDSGRRWRPIGQPQPGSAIDALLAFPPSPGWVVAGLRPAAIAAGDGQSAWQTSHAGNYHAVYQLLRTPGDQAPLLALTDGHLLMGQRDGPWHPLTSLPAPVTAVANHPETPNTLFAIGPGGLFRTRNGGRHWQQISHEAGNAILVQSVRQRPTLIVGRPRGLYQSTTAGSSWQPMAGGQTDTDPVVTLLGQPQTELILAITAGGQLLQWQEQRWQAPLMGSLPPVLSAALASGESGPWAGVPKRAQARRRRPAKGEGSDRHAAPANDSAGPPFERRAGPAPTTRDRRPGPRERAGDGQREGRPEGPGERRPDAQHEGPPEGRGERPPDAQHEGRPEGRGERPPDAQREGRPEGRGERRSDAQREGRPEGRGERRSDAQREGRPEGRSERRGEGTRERRPGPPRQSPPAGDDSPTRE